ncbi:AAA domain-containing protein [Roseibium hamelinense]|uniref:AAA domain-containing protein n=1 Tax=Roseibium hamelinense TaxID=150831 RepID=A0A562T1L6_9HYPH|nr:AAA family ATPase [Roseibium hamelinense]TWI87048.1 AAA domain-containing protein [Roseibium hamelinense]
MDAVQELLRLNSAPNYAMAALNAEIDRVYTAPEGQRNDTLNRSAFSLFQLVANDQLPHETVTRALTHAAERAGLEIGEIEKTLLSAERGAMRKPRDLSHVHGYGHDHLSPPQQLPKPQRHFTFQNSNDLLAAQFETVKWIVPDYLTEGFNVLAGRQKLGKTWLAIDWAIAVATGGMAMGKIDVEAGDVLYIDMENGPRRIQSRINTLLPFNKPDLSRLTWAAEPIPLNEGFTMALDKWCQYVASPRLIVVDVLQRIKPAGGRSRNAYENDYAAFSGLQQWATNTGVSVLALHHTRKGGADDPLEALSGSNGLSACADTTLVLDRDNNGITLYVRGRDVEEIETALRFDAGIWTIQGDAQEIRQSDERARIRAELEQADEPLTPTDIQALTSMKAGSVRRLLIKMVGDGQIQKVGRGQYAHKDYVFAAND